MRTWAGIVMVLLVVVELAAGVAAGVWGAHVAGPIGAVVAVAVFIAVWAAFVSPKAPWGSPSLRLAAQQGVFLITSFGLWLAGHPVWAIALWLTSTFISSVAVMPAIRDANPFPVGPPGPPARRTGSHPIRRIRRRGSDRHPRQHAGCESTSVWSDRNSGAGVGRVRRGRRVHRYHGGDELGTNGHDTGSRRHDDRQLVRQLGHLR